METCLYTTIITYIQMMCSHGKIKTKWTGMSLVVQWLGVRLAMRGMRVSSFVRELRYRTPQGN